MTTADDYAIPALAAVAARPDDELISRHLIGQRSDFLDPDFDDVARLEEFPARRADPGGRAGENDVARFQCHTLGEIDLSLIHI